MIWTSSLQFVVKIKKITTKNNICKDQLLPHFKLKSQKLLKAVKYSFISQR